MKLNLKLKGKNWPYQPFILMVLVGLKRAFVPNLRLGSSAIISRTVSSRATDRSSMNSLRLYVLFCVYIREASQRKLSRWSWLMRFTMFKMVCRGPTFKLSLYANLLLEPAIVVCQPPRWIEFGSIQPFLMNPPLDLRWKMLIVGPNKQP